MLSRIFLVFAMGCIYFSSPVNAQQSLNTTVKAAKSLIAQQSYQQAYDLLVAKEGIFGGEPTFDYYLGLSALQTGKPAEAVFALERALDTKPDFQQARAELGRAYYYLGENKAAKTEFDKVKSDSATPSGVKTTIDKFLAAIDSRFDSSGKKLELFIETTLGYDSNINAAPDTVSRTSAIFPGFVGTLTEDSRETESAFLTFKPSINYIHPIKDDLNMFASANIVLNNAIDADQFNAQTINFSSGLAKLAGANQYHGLVAFKQHEVEEQDFGQDLVSISAQWIKTLSPQNKITSYIQFSDASYDDGVKDGSINSLGVNWLQGNAKGIIYYSAYLGDERVDRQDQQDQAKHFFGIKVGTRRGWRDKTIFGNIVYQLNHFKAADDFYFEKRDSTFISLDIGIDIPFMHDLKVSPKLSFSQNDTDNNILEYNYDRTVLDVTARYNF